MKKKLQLNLCPRVGEMLSVIKIPRSLGWGFLLLLFSTVITAATNTPHLFKPAINHTDKASLQRGAKLYMNYCAGCHSLQYMRYISMAKDIGITDATGKVYLDVLKENLILDKTAKPYDTLYVSMPKHDVKNWFGVVPPDLSLVIRQRGVDWIYTYLHSFYRDNNRPWGTNNELLPGVAMPNILLDLQGEQDPVYVSKRLKLNGTYKDVKVLDYLKLTKPGRLASVEFDRVLTDLVNFLDYVAEPIKVERRHLGFWVLGFLLIFTILAYLLKREYWKDIKNMK